MSKSHLLPIFSPLPVCFQKGEGVWLTDTQGNVYLDGFAGIAVNAVGHNHPRLVSALQKQVSELIHVSNYFRIDLQEEVAAQHPDLVERFHGMLTGWLRDCDAAFPTPNPDFK